MVTVLSIDTIVSDPAVRGGRPVIAGSTVRVSDVAAFYTLGGLSPEEVAIQLHLSLGQVHAALAYYYTHQVEIDGEIRTNAQEAEHWQRLLAEQGRLIRFE